MLSVTAFGVVTTSFFMLFWCVGVFSGMFDCSDLAQYGVIDNSVYPLLSDGASHPLSAKDVYCDMETDGGG